MAAPAKSTPRDAQIIAAILKDMSIHDYEPRLINQLLEFIYRYATDILDDAKVYSSHAGRKNLDVEDVKLAIQCRIDHSFTSPPPRDLLMDIARHKNCQPLPLIKPSSGLRLPPDRYCLSNPNYKLKSSKKRIQIGLPVNHQFSTQRINFAPVQGSSNSRMKSSSGVSSGGTLTVVSKPAAQPTVTIISKPITTTSGSTLKPTIRVASATSTPKPVQINLASAPGSLVSSASIVKSSQPLPASTKTLATSVLSTIPTSVIPITAENFQGVKRKLEDDDYDK